MSVISIYNSRQLLGLKPIQTIFELLKYCRGSSVIGSESLRLTVSVYIGRSVVTVLSEFPSLTPSVRLGLRLLNALYRRGP